MRPLVPNLAQFTYQTPLGMTKRVSENIVPLIPQGGQERRDLPFRLILRPEKFRLNATERFAGLGEPRVLINALQLPLHKRLEATCQKFEALADPLMIGNRHSAE